MDGPSRQATKPNFKHLKNANSIRATNQPAPETNNLVYTSTKRYTYDFSQPSPSISEEKQSLIVSVKGLNLSKTERHKFLVLAGDRYDPYEDKVTLTLRDDETEAVPGSSKEKLELLERLEKLIAEAKDAKDTFKDIPVDLRHTSLRKRGLAFPKEWLQKPAGTAAPKSPVA
ncbi:37S ribosomal protein S24, mitochondrial [Chytridiales sp. JEL 0842]|nr:37S ribosomal protein S24, mitochondrial [Chytridiales sp. JEL 0842]